MNIIDKNVNILTEKQCLDRIKRLSGNTNDCILEFDDWVKNIHDSKSFTIGLRVMSKHLKNKEYFFRWAYNEGRKEVATLVMRIERLAIFKIAHLESENDKLKAEIERLKNAR